MIQELFFLVYADVVHVHALRQRGILIGDIRLKVAQRHVDDDPMILMEGIHHFRIIDAPFHIHAVITIEFDGILIPLDGENVIGICPDAAIHQLTVVGADLVVLIAVLTPVQVKGADLVGGVGILLRRAAA